MIPLGPVVARSRVGVARAAAWTFLAEQHRRSEWWPELQLEPHVGGTVAERWSEGEGDAAVSRDASGTVDVWVEGHAVGFTWREAGDERDTAVLITLRTQGVDTGITVTETGFDALPAASERAAASQEGWQVLLNDLVTALQAAQAAGAFGERETPAAGAGELEVVEPEVVGEIDEAAEPVDQVDAADEIELEAEPTVGDHPELETGPVAVVAGAGDAASGAPLDLDETIQIDRAQLDAALAQPGESVGDAGEIPANEGDASAEQRRAERPDEPDFDTLIRGN